MMIFSDKSLMHSRAVCVDVNQREEKPFEVRGGSMQHGY